MPDANAVAGQLADELTARHMAEKVALLSIYDVNEKAAFEEGLIAGAFQAGRLSGLAEGAVMVQKVLGAQV